MSKKKSFKKSNPGAGYLLLIFVFLAILMFSNAWLEISQSKKDLQELMEQQSHSLLESLIMASGSILQSNNYLETLYRERLLSNAVRVKNMYEKGNINNRLLEEFADNNNIYRINIYNSKGEKIFSNHVTVHDSLVEKFSPRQVLRPIFLGEEDTLYLGLRPARFENGFRYALAVATKDRHAVVLNVNATALAKVRLGSGLGVMLKNVVTENPQIIYAALQDSFNILAAAGTPHLTDDMSDSPFLREAYDDSLFMTRQIEHDSMRVFEAVHPFAYDGEKRALFRLGLSLQPLDEINARIYRRFLMISFVLVALGSFFLSFLFIRQRYSILQKRYSEVETYSQGIIENVNDAIIVLDGREQIKIINRAACKLFGCRQDDYTGRLVRELFMDEKLHAVLDSQFTFGPVDCNVQGMARYLFVSRAAFTAENMEETIILVIKDLTEIKQLEIQIQRKERLTAMGELAAGVAHEIRNPLNTIGTIVQQLDKDFSPVSNIDEYHQLSGLVYSEVKRINQTVQDFLKFARPGPLLPTTFKLNELLDEIGRQYAAVFTQRNIRFSVKNSFSGEVFWDRQQIRQVLLNLFQNALDAMQDDGSLGLGIENVRPAFLQISVEDNGPGILEEDRSRIFNLYYSTKATGTGIGLSIVQRIVDDHQGTIRVESEVGRFTRFIIELPEQVNK